VNYFEWSNPLEELCTKLVQLFRGAYDEDLPERLQMLTSIVNLFPQLPGLVAKGTVLLHLAVGNGAPLVLIEVLVEADITCIDAYHEMLRGFPMNVAIVARMHGSSAEVVEYLENKLMDYLVLQGLGATQHFFFYLMTAASACEFAEQATEQFE